MRTVLGGSRREAEAFAALLERDRTPSATPDELAALAALARSLAPAPLAPLPGFRAALRERLVAEAAARTVGVPAPRSAATFTAAPTTSTRIRQAVATMALVSVVGGAGAAAASTRALPGDALYGLKRQVEAVQLALAFTDLARGRELLDQAGARLGEAERLAASGRRDEPATRAEIEAVLRDWASATAAGAEALTTSYRDTGSPEPMQVLERFVTDSEERLQDLLLLLDPSLRAQVREALAELGRLGAQATAVLPAQATGTAATPGSGPAGTAVALASGDGWAVSRVLEHTAMTTLAAGGPALAGASGPGASGSGPAEGVAGNAVASATGGGSGSSGSSGVLGGPLTGGSTATTDPLDPLDPLDPGTAVPSPGSSVRVSDPLAPLPSGGPTATLPLGDLTSTTTTGSTSGTTTGTATTSGSTTTGSTTSTPQVTAPTVPCVPLPPLTSC